MKRKCTLRKRTSIVAKVSRRSKMTCFKRYKDVLDIFQNMSGLKEVDKAINKGFRVHEQGMVTHEQNKLGLSAYYDSQVVYIQDCYFEGLLPTIKRWNI